MASTVKTFTRKQVGERTSSKEAVFIIENLVYDVTQFLDEHPGGHEVLVNVIGKDASEDFDDVGHSLDAKELMKKYQVGELVDEDKVEINKRHVKWADSDAQKEVSNSFISSWKFPVVLGILMTVLYTYLFG